MTPYEVVYGQPPLLHLPYLPHESNVEAIDRSFSVREEMLRILKSNLHKAVNRMKVQADKGRSEREFKIGDWVFLKLQAYRQGTVEKRRSDKLSPRFYGPYEVIAKVGSVAYTLRLPNGTRIHPTFHVSLLKRYPDSSMTPVHPLDEFAAGVATRKPAFILERRLIRKKDKAIIEVLVQWKDESRDKASWEDWLQFQTKLPAFAESSHP